MIKILKYVAIIWVVFLATVAIADTPIKEYKPSEVQLLRLQVKHKDAEIAQMRYEQAQQSFRLAISALQEEGNKVKEENKWSKDVLFNTDALSFSEPPTPTPTPEKKPEVKK